MAEDWKPYVVHQGDHVRKLAFRVGITADEVWKHPSNAALKEMRATMDMLCPGDLLHLPSAPPPALEIYDGTTNRYRVRIPTITVHMRLASHRRSLGNELYEVHGIHDDSDPPTGSTGPDGELALVVPIHTRECEIHLPNAGLVVPVRVGELDPPTERSGVIQRLRNLGYLSGAGPVDDEHLAAAIKRFQADHQMPPTGNMDRDTIAALEAAHLS